MEPQTESTSKARLILPNAPADQTGPVKLWEQDVEMLTYEPGPADPNPVFLEKRVYQGSSGRIYPLPVIDNVQTVPVTRSWRAIHLENEYLRIMVLPEIGGRIHLAMNKQTGYDFIYRQNVIKPALVGLAGPWASGGIEFNWPQHHRPATFMPVDVALELRKDGSAIAWCSDIDPMERMKGMHGVCLHPGRAFMEVMVRLYNRTTETRTFLWWANVATHVHEKYQSFFPRDVRRVADHARRATSSYPLSHETYYGIDYGARAANGITPEQMPSQFIPGDWAAPNDLGWYANIPVPTSYMIAGSAGDFSGGYDHRRSEGTLAIANHHTQPGKKQWTWGNHEFGYAWDRCLTDSDGPYVELMVGAYTENQPDFSWLAPGETKTFSQYWYPFAEIGIPDTANLDCALRLEHGPDGTTVHLHSTEDRAQCTVTLEADGRTLFSWRGDLLVASPLHASLADGAVQGKITVVVAQEDRVLLRYAPDDVQPAPPPEEAEEPAAPEDITSNDQLYLTGLHLEQYRHPTRPAEIYWREAVRRDPGDSRCQFALGRMHRRLGQFALAEQALRASIARLQKRNPNPPEGEPHYELGLTLQLTGRFDEAYAAFYKATWLAAWAGPAYHRLAEIDCQRQNWSSALDHLERSLIKSADNLGALGLKVYVLRQLHRAEEAETLRIATAALDPLDAWSAWLATGAYPADGQACLDLCFDLLRAGLRREAYSLLQASLRSGAYRNPDGSRTLHRYLAASIARALDLPEASAWTADARAADTRYVFPHRLEELLLLEETIAADPANGHAPLFLGNLLYDKGRRLEALQQWERAVALDAAQPTAWRNLAIAQYNVHHDNAAALSAFLKARQYDPHSARLLYELDQLRARLGQQPSERLAALEVDWPLVLQRDDLTLAAASLLNSLGRPAEALELLLSRQFQPWEGGEGMVLAEYVRAHLLLSVDQLRESKPQEAVAHLTDALHPPQTLGEVRHVLQNTSMLDYWLGIALARAGDASRSREHLERAAAQQEDFLRMRVETVSPATFWTALALRELGRTAEADDLFASIQRTSALMLQEPARVDFFATSLPNLSLFDQDPQQDHVTEALFYAAQAAVGLRNTDGLERLRQVLERNPSHSGALDLLRMEGR